MKKQGGVVGRVCPKDSDVVAVIKKLTNERIDAVAIHCDDVASRMVDHLLVKLDAEGVINRKEVALRRRMHAGSTPVQLALALACVLSLAIIL